MPRSVPSNLIIAVAVCGLTFGLPRAVWAEKPVIEQVQDAMESIVAIKAMIPTDILDQEQGKGLPKKKKGFLFFSSKPKIGIFERTGAGIIVDPRGYIVTNTHTVIHSKQIKVTLNDGTETFVKTAKIAQGYDFTIIKIVPPHPLKAIEFADSSRVRLGDDIISIGNSPLLKDTISGGKVIGMGISRTTNMADLFQVDINFYKGDSGGPILDREGKLLGIVLARQTRVDKSSFVLPSNKIREFLNAYFQDNH